MCPFRFIIFENDSIPKDAEELKEYFRTHENKKFNIYYELAIPEVEELKMKL